MRAFIAVSGAALAIAAAAPALAQAPSASPVYGSLGYSQGGYQGADLGAVQARLGARINPYVGAEGEIATGVDDDHADIAGTLVKTELKRQAAVYGVGFLPVTPKADLYARVGYGNTKIKASVPGASATADGDSVNYGVGGQYALDDRNGLRADYTRHDFRHDRGEVDSWSLGYVRKF